MSVLMSWALSTLATFENALGNSDRWFDRILVGVLVLLAVAVVFLFLAVT
jgi:ABC-type multidrug transport system permease subunit